MISWTIAGTVPPLTGETKVEGSSSSSSSGSANGTNEVQLFRATFNGSASASAYSTFVEATTHNISGSTTYFSRTSNATYTEQWKITDDLTPDAQANPANNYTGPTFRTQTFSSSSSASDSGSTSQQLTAFVETSTTESYESYFQTTQTTSFEADGEEIAFVPVWTTSSETIEGGTQTSVAFYQSDGTSGTGIQTSFSTREATVDAVTVLSNTVAIAGLPDTVVQAATRYAEDAEVIYVLSSPISEITGYSAATEFAASGTRITVAPSIVTAAKIAADYSRATSLINSAESTAVVALTSTATTQETYTAANYFYFPPTTTTQTRFGFTTIATEIGTNVLCFQNELAHGATSNTQTAREFSTYSKVVAMQRGNVTFQSTAQSTTTFTVTQTVQAAATSSYSNSASETVAYGIWYGLTTDTGQSASASFQSSGVTGNTVAPTVRASTGIGGICQQAKCGTIGAAIDTNKGNWITANSTSEGFVFFEDAYALDGKDRRATTMFAATNSARTINKTGISWTTSTNATLSVDGATSKRTTLTASFGVSGTAQTTTFATPIGNCGGVVGSAETFIQTATPGLYKNKIDGTTTSFDGAATVFSAGQSLPVSAWEAITDIRGLANASNANAFTWAEPRNSTNLPPAMPPNA